MKRGEALFYLCVMIACLVYLFVAQTSMSVGSFTSPGPGFLPSILAICSFAIAGILFAGSLKRLLKDRKDNPQAFRQSFAGQPESRRKLIKLLIFVASMVVYLLLFNVVNFYISTFVLMAIMGKLFGMKGWIAPIAMGGIFVIAVYLVFAIGFKMYI